MIYLDNNGTTKICKQSKDATIKWLESRSNPSSDSVIAKKAKQMVEKAKAHVLKHCGASSGYTAIFTSGASESNSFILRSVADAYKTHTKQLPHIITSMTEHKSIIQCCNCLVKNMKAEVTFIAPNAYGQINPEAIAQAIKGNTALVSIMAANNELGTINNIRAIAEAAHAHNVPFHTDAVQIFGKYKMHMKKNGIDVLSMSFHKLHGPMGLGLLVISNNLINGYGLEGQISGTQQRSLRGGTENVPAIAAVVPSINCTFTDREKKNKRLMELRHYFIESLRKKIPQGEYRDILSGQSSRNEFIVLGPKCNGNPAKPNVLPNTVLVSFVKVNGSFCNVKLKKCLDKKKIIVSVGSACSTSSKKASHVLRAIKAPDKIKQGVLRVSMSDHTTKKEITAAVKELVKCVQDQFRAR